MEGLIINSKINCDKEFIDLGILLKFIGRLGSGREVVDIPYAESKGIRVCFPQKETKMLLRSTLGMLLSLANQINRADRELQDRKSGSGNHGEGGSSKEKRSEL